MKMILNSKKLKFNNVEIIIIIKKLINIMIIQVNRMKS